MKKNVKRNQQKTPTLEECLKRIGHDPQRSYISEAYRQNLDVYHLDILRFSTVGVFKKIFYEFFGFKQVFPQYLFAHVKATIDTSGSIKYQRR